MSWFKSAAKQNKNRRRDGEIVLHLDRIMLECGISLAELSEQVGISNVNLSKIKNNHVVAVRFSTLAALCAVLGCEVGDLIEFIPAEK